MSFVIIIPVLGWLALLGSAYVFQEKLLFHPESLPSDYVYRFPGQWIERTFVMQDGERLAALHFQGEQNPDERSRSPRIQAQNLVQSPSQGPSQAPSQALGPVQQLNQMPSRESTRNPSPSSSGQPFGKSMSSRSQGVVLYFHGNAGNLASWGEVAEDFVRLGFDVVLVDYRGYGKSSGSIRSEAVLHEDAAQVYETVAEEYQESQIVLLGRSLGTGIAAKLAADRNPQRLILETPYYDMVSAGREHYPWLLPHLISRYQLTTAQYLGRVQCAVDVIHGTEDQIVPYDHSLRLKKQHSKIKLWTIEGGGHNDLREGSTYHQHLAKILRSQTQR